MTVATTDSNTKIPWQFWTALAGVLTVEVIACLIGFRILNRALLGQISLVVVWTWTFGWRLEAWMRTRGEPPASDKEYLALAFRSGFLGSMYFVTAVGAMFGRLVPWLLAFSIALFLGLMARICWLYTKRPAARAA